MRRNCGIIEDGRCLSSQAHAALTPPSPRTCLHGPTLCSDSAFPPLPFLSRRVLVTTAVTLASARAHGCCSTRVGPALQHHFVILSTIFSACCSCQQVKVQRFSDSDR